MDKKTLLETLYLNRDKNFIQRIVNSQDYPTLDLGEGKTATHLMSWGEVEGNYIVYPAVVYNEKSKDLKRHSPKKAMDYAIESGEYIVFDTEEEADWFSKNYKDYWK